MTTGLCPYCYRRVRLTSKTGVLHQHYPLLTSGIAGRCPGSWKPPYRMTTWVSPAARAKDLLSIRKRAEAASPQPAGTDENVDTVEFLQHARSDVLYLLEEIVRLDGVIDRLTIQSITEA